MPVLDKYRNNTDSTYIPIATLPPFMDIDMDPLDHIEM